VFVGRKVKKLKNALEETVGKEADPNVKELVYAFDRLSKTVFGGLTITHKYERMPKPIRGCIAIRMEDGRDYLGTPFYVSKSGGTNYANLPCVVKVGEREINHVSIVWEYE